MTSWRIALAYVAFSVLALALFAIPLWHGWRENVGTLRVFVPEDLQALPDLFRLEGPDAVAAAVRARSDPTNREVLLFAGPGREVLAGTLRHWPTEIPDAPGTYGQVIDLGGGALVRIVVTHVPLPGGYNLIMGRESAGTMSLQGRFWPGMAAAVILLLGFGGALVWRLARRADAARRSGERHERAMLAAEAGFWDWDVLTDDYYISPKLLEMGGFPANSRFSGRADFMSRTPLHPDDLSRWQSAITTLFAGNDTRLAMEVRFLRGADVHWANVSGICLRDAAGRSCAGPGRRRTLPSANALKTRCGTLGRAMPLRWRQRRTGTGIGTWLRGRTTCRHETTRFMDSPQGPDLQVGPSSSRRHICRGAVKIRYAVGGVVRRYRHSYQYGKPRDCAGETKVVPAQWNLRSRPFREADSMDGQRTGCD